MMWRLNIAAIVVVMGVVLAGCKKDEANSTSENKFQPDTDTESSSETAVVPTSDSQDRSPASGSDINIPVDAAPQTIVESYVVALNQGNEKKAEAFLTEVARIETRRAELVVQPAWSSNATYQITAVDFATDRPIRAEVQTEWVERTEDGATADFTIVWMLFKQPHNGWRISGMKTHFTPGGNLIFLNFEDPEDMIARWEQGMLEAERESQIRTAQNPDNDIR